MSANVRNAVRLSVVSLSGLLALSACDQPAAKCSIARGAFAARYTLVSGTGDCATLTGEQIGVDVYYQPISKKDPQPDLDHTFVALQPDSLTGALAATAGLAQPNAEDHPYAFGPFAQTDPNADFCIVTAPSTARVRLPAIPEQMDMCTTTPAQPAVDISYTWSNVKVYVTPSAYGTQFAADLTYVKDGCTAQYHVTAVYPAVSCGVDTTAAPAAPATDPDAGASEAGTAGATDAGIAQGMDAAVDMDAAGPETGEDGSSPTEDDGACPKPDEPAGPQTADETLCSPNPDVSKGRAVGSGINPDFNTVCDPTLLLCVLKSEPPSLR